MLLATKGLAIRTLEEAEAFLREFIYETLLDPNGPMQRHSHDYDLFLPWAYEEIRNAPPPSDHEVHLAVVIDRILMDAAWSLVTKGYLRPGPRLVSSEVRGGDYGKGFALLPPGVGWVKALEADRHQ